MKLRRFFRICIRHGGAAAILFITLNYPQLWTAAANPMLAPFKKMRIFVKKKHASDDQERKKQLHRITAEA